MTHVRTGNQVEGMLQRLVEVFTEQEDAHASMLEAIDCGETGLREGRIDTFVESCRRQQGCALRMQRLEEARIELVTQIGRAMAWPHGEVPTISDIVAAAPDELGRQLEETVQRLKPLAHRTHTRCRVIRNAVTSLSRHFSSLLQGVHGALGRAGTYGRLGTLARENQLEFNVDLQS